MGGWVSAPPRHTLSRRLPTTTRSPLHAPEARGAPARRVDAPLRCGVPQGPHRLVRWCGGVVRRGVSVGAEQARARTPFASPAGDSAIRRPRRSGCARLCALRARTARIRLRDGRGCWWRVSTPRACPHRSSVDGKRLPDQAWAACRRRALVVHSSASSGVLAELRGQNKRAHRREPGADWGRARCMPRGRRPRAVGRAGSMQLELRRQAWHSCARGRSAGGASARHQRAYIAPPWTTCHASQRVRRFFL